MRYQISDIKTKATTKDDFHKISVIEWHQSGRKKDSAPPCAREIMANVLRGRCIWFSWEENQLISLFHSGANDEDIAAALAVTPYSVQGRRKRLGLLNYEMRTYESLVPKIKQCLNAGMTMDQTAKAIKGARSLVARVCKEYGISFRKYGSQNHCSKVDRTHRAAICQLHDIGFKPEILSAAFGYHRKLIECVVYYSPSSETVDLMSVPEAVKLLSCDLKMPGSRITPAECLLMEREGLQSFLEKTGRSVNSAMNNFFYSKRGVYYHLLANNMRNEIGEVSNG